MKFQKLWTAAFLVIMVFSLAIPGFNPGSVQANVAPPGWTENPANAVLSSGSDSSTPTIIYDSTDHVYKAWFVKTTIDAATVDGFIDGLAPNFTADLINDLRTGNFSNIAAADTGSVKDVISSLAGLSTSELTDLCNSACTTVMYSESSDGTTWSVPTATDLTCSPTEWDAFISAPNVIKDGGTYRMWYTGATMNAGTLKTLFTDINKLTAIQMGTVLNDLVNGNISALWTDLSATTLVPATFMDDILNFLASGRPQIGYAESSDGTTWTKNALNPIMTTGGTGAWDNFGVSTPSVIKNAGGGYEMWYTGIKVDSGMLDILSATTLAEFQTDLMNNITIAIGHATSTDGITGWVKDAGPVLTKDSASWDANAVFAPSVIRNSEGSLEMWYTGAQIDPGTIFSYLHRDISLNNAILNGFNPAIGHATFDGSVWNKDAANPVISRETGAWDEYGVAYPSVVQNGQTQIMLYTGWTTDLSSTLSDILTGAGISTALDNTHVAIGEAELTFNTLTLTVTPPGGGTTSPAVGTQSYATGTVVPISAADGTGYHFVNWTGGTVAAPTSPTTTVAMNGNYTLTANFAINTYTLTYTAGANGSISGTSPQTVNSGASGTAVTAVANVGYHFVNWSDASTANPRTDTNVTGNISVTANFAQTTYTLTYTAGANGSISGTSPQTVNSGASGTAVTAMANVGYHFVNWSDASTANPRTDTNVTGNISVTANFAQTTYTLTYTAGANGSISGTSPQTVNSGASGTAVTAVANVGYHFVNWSDASTANPRTDTNVTGNISVTANFAQTTYTLTYTAGANGSISGTSPQTVNSGASGTAVTAMANVGYHFVNWSDASTANPRTDTNVTGNISVTANFAQTTYTLTYTAGANGSISGTSPQTVNSGASGTAVTAVANVGYHFVNWSDASTANPRTDTNVTGNISVTANFAQTTYTLTYTAGANGTISGTSPQTVNYLASGTAVTAVPNSGYYFTSWSDGVLTASRTDNGVTANISVTANFAADTTTPPPTSSTTTTTTSTTTPTSTTTTSTTTTSTTTETSTSTTTTTTTSPIETTTPPVTTTVTGTGTVDVSNDVNAGGEFTQPVTLGSADNNATINIPAGITGTTADGQPLSSITVTQMSELPAPLPAGDNIISASYEFGPSGAHFSSPITMTFSYDPTKLASGVPETNLVIAYYSVSDGQWITLGGVVDTLNHTITVQVSHFTTFAVLEQPAVTTTSTGIPTSPTTPVQKPASFTSSGLNISPSQVKSGEQVNISITVQNTGDVTGTNTETLKINKLVEGTQDITLSGGASTTLTFTASGKLAGTYVVEIDGLSGTFTVSGTPAQTWIWPTIIGVIAVLVILAIAVLMLRRRTA